MRVNSNVHNKMIDLLKRCVHTVAACALGCTINGERIWCAEKDNNSHMSHNFMWPAAQRCNHETSSSSAASNVVNVGPSEDAIVVCPCRYADTVRRSLLHVIRDCENEDSGRIKSFSILEGMLAMHAAMSRADGISRGSIGLSSAASGNQ